MTTTYQAFVWETKEDIDRLQSSKYNLQVAKSVANPDGKPSFNVIYASHILGPNMSVSWTTQYGLNWTTDIPDPGAKVTYSGHWQPCSLGQSFDIDDDGFFVENDNNPDARDDSLNIGSNNYGDPDGVNIIIGVQDSKGDWNPIWLDSSKLVQKAHGEYQPLESVRLWFDEFLQSGTVIASQSTNYKDYKFEEHLTYYFHYSVGGEKGGTWEASPKPPPLKE